MARTVDIARRREIALKAFEIMKERGVYRTTMSDIAAGLEMKRPTLYWYFKDFGEIFEAVVSETDDELRAHVMRRLSGVTHPIDTLIGIVEATVDFFAERSDRVMVLFQLWAVTGEVAPARIAKRSREFVQPVRDELVRQLEQGIADGVVAPCDAAAVIDLAFSVIDGAHVQQVTRGADPRRMLDGLRTYVLEPLRISASARKRSAR
jgi:AcrR family transcriptional regulator